MLPQKLDTQISDNNIAPLDLRDYLMSAIMELTKEERQELLAMWKEWKANGTMDAKKY